MKFLTKLIISGSPKARTFDREIEAASPDQAAELAEEYWNVNWKGQEITNRTVIHVYGYKPDSGELDKQLLWNRILHRRRGKKPR